MTRAKTVPAARQTLELLKKSARITSCLPAGLFSSRKTDLCVGAGVPVRVVDDDSVGPGQVHSYATHPCGQKKDKDGRVLQERSRTEWAQLRAAAAWHLPHTTSSAAFQQLKPHMAESVTQPHLRVPACQFIITVSSAAQADTLTGHAAPGLRSWHFISNLICPMFKPYMHSQRQNVARHGGAHL